MSDHAIHEELQTVQDKADALLKKRARLVKTFYTAEQVSVAVSSIRTMNEQLALLVPALMDALCQKDEEIARLKATVTTCPADASMPMDRQARLQKFREDYFTTPPGEISQLAHDGMIVVIDLEATLRQQSSAHRLEAVKE